MKINLPRIVICLPLLLLGLGQQVLAQSQSLASTMDVYVFPTEGQDSSQQSKDEATCYEWAVGNVGTDPFELGDRAEADEQQAEQAHQDASQTGQGSGARGAVRGAAAGALIGEIANDDAGKGAAYGAAAGMISSRRRAKRGQQQATQQAETQGQQAQANIAEQGENFKKAFSVCMEAKKYMVKY